MTETAAKEVIEKIKCYTGEEYYGRYGEIESCLAEIEQGLKGLPAEDRKSVLCGMAEQAEDAWLCCRLHILSFCMEVSGEAFYAEQMLRSVRQASYEELGEYQKLFYFWQISTAVFMDCQLKNFEVERQLAQLYMELFDAFKRAFQDLLGITERTYIPIEQRNPELVIVFTSQVLGMNHAPTKTLVDRCRTLVNDCGKKVFIVNTSMQMTKKGESPFYRTKEAAYEESLRNASVIEYKGMDFAYYQCPNQMPDLKEMYTLIQTVREKKPLYILDIGGSDICADLCGMFVPQITVSTVFSQIATSCGEYQLAEKELTENDRKILEIFDVKPQNIRKTKFTFSFKEQKHRYTREQMGLADGAFLLLVVGWRLDMEADEEFLKMLDGITARENGIKAVFMGQFCTYQEKVARYPSLCRNSYYLGKQEDALAVTELCKLYVNPRRNGGGSSAAEALYKGLPVVTLPHGDVATAVGEDFFVSDYTQMQEKILKYYHDADYYTAMSQTAKKCAEVLLDSSTHFTEAIKEIEYKLNTPVVFQEGSF